MRCILRKPINNSLRPATAKLLLKSSASYTKINAYTLCTSELIVWRVLHKFSAECVSRDISKYTIGHVVTVLRKEKSATAKLLLKSSAWYIKINAYTLCCSKLNVWRVLHKFSAECVSRDISKYTLGHAVTVLQKEELCCLCLGMLA